MRKVGRALAVGGLAALLSSSVALPVNALLPHAPAGFSPLRAPVSTADPTAHSDVVSVEAPPAAARPQEDMGTPQNPAWYDFYVVGLKTDNSDVHVTSEDSVQTPESVTESQVREQVAKVDAYYRENTMGAVRVRLAGWSPFTPFQVSDPCRNGATAIWNEAQRRAGVTESARNVLMAAITNRCGPAGVAGIRTVLTYGTLEAQVLGHEFGHSHLQLDHESSSDCLFADALTRCVDPKTGGSYFEYWGSSIMSADHQKLDPLLPTDLYRLGLLAPTNTVVLPTPPDEPVDINISNLPIGSGASILQLGTGLQALFVSRSASTNESGRTPVVQVSQTPDAQDIAGYGITGNTVISRSGANLVTGRTHCGESGFCVEVLSQSVGGARIQVSKRGSQFPVAPSNLRAEATPDGRIRLDWDAPAGGPELRGYDLHYWNALEERPSANSVHLNSSEASWLTPPGVLNGRYEFRLASDTSNGTSATTAVAITVDNRSVPGVATPEIRLGTLGSATVWAACDPNGYAITERRYYYTDNPMKPIDQWATSSNGALTGLTPHRQYTVRAQCKNAAGWGETGQTTISLPDIPRQPAMTKWDVSYGPDGLYFSAGYASRNPYGDPETGVKVTLSPGGASCENSEGVGRGLPTACTITGLPPNRQYTARVVLTSSVGESPAQLLPVATEVLPTDPRNLRVSVDAQQRAVLTWDPVEGLYGDPAVTYRVTVDDSDACTTSQARCILPAMNAGVSHAIRVYGRTLAGESQPGMLIYSPTKTTVGPPSQPPVGSPPGTARPGGSPKSTPGGSSAKTQTMKKVRHKVRLGKKLPLPRRSTQGARISWSVTSPKKCRVKTHQLVPLKKGTCRLVADAPARAGFAVLHRALAVKISP